MPARNTITIGAIFLLLLCAGTEVAAQVKNPAQQTWRRDPFRYVSATPRTTATEMPEKGRSLVARPAQALTGIFVSNGVYQALYGGRLVRRGDRVGNTLIREVTLYAVVVDDGTERRKIELFHEKQGRERDE